MYSAWQVLPGTLSGWTKRCLGKQLTPAEFESNATAARETITCVLKSEFTRVYRAAGNNETAAARNFACWWMTGTENGCASGVNAAYVQKVLGYYQQQARAGSSSGSPTEKPAASESKPAPKPTEEPAAKPTPGN